MHRCVVVLWVEGAVRRWQRTTIALGISFAATPAAPQDKFELPLNALVTRDGNIINQHDSNSAKMSFGSVGLDSHAGDSHRHEYFNIPDERSFKKVPGVWLKIPLGN